MANRYVLSVNTKPETRDRLDRLAAATQRSKSFLANEAIERYLADEEAFLSQLETRRREIGAHGGLSSDEVLKLFEDRMRRKLSTKNS